MAERTHGDKRTGPGRSSPSGKGASTTGPSERTRRSTRGRGPTPKGGRKAGETGRYTPPIPRSQKRSPRWYPWMILTLLGLGVLMIILNYVNALPNSPTNWYTLGGVILLLAGAMSATGYR